MFPFGPFELSILVVVNLTSQRIDWTEKLSDSHLQGYPANNHMLSCLFHSQWNHNLQKELMLYLIRCKTSI